LCRVLLEKLTGLQLVKKFPAFHGTQRFTTTLQEQNNNVILNQLDLRGNMSTHVEQRAAYEVDILAIARTKQ